MSESQPPPGVGTVYFPAPDVPRNGADGRSRADSPGPPGPAAGRLRVLPRRRRPAVLALAVAMVAVGVVVSAALYQRASHQEAVVMVVREVPAGAVISAGDLGTTSVTVGSGVRVIPAAQRGQVAGEVAAVTLQPATLLAPSQLTTERPPAPGQALVAAAVKPAELPASGLFPGDHVLVVATPGDQGQAGSAAAAASLSAPAPAVVEAVTRAPDSDGFDVVDLLVSDGTAVAVAGQVSTGQFALVVTRRS